MEMGMFVGQLKELPTFGFPPPPNYSCYVITTYGFFLILLLITIINYFQSLCLCLFWLLEAQTHCVALTGLEISL